MKYDGKWFGDHLATFPKDKLKAEVASTFDGDPDKDKKIDELYGLFHPPADGNDKSPAGPVSKS